MNRNAESSFLETVTKKVEKMIMSKTPEKRAELLSTSKLILILLKKYEKRILLNTITLLYSIDEIMKSEPQVSSDEFLSMMSGFVASIFYDGYKEGQKNKNVEGGGK